MGPMSNPGAHARVALITSQSKGRVIMQLRVKLAAGVAVLGIAGVSTAAIAHDRSRFDADLSGYEELPTLSTQGVGSFKAALSRGGDELRYELSYSGPFDGNATATASSTNSCGPFGRARPTPTSTRPRTRAERSAARSRRTTRAATTDAAGPR